MVRGHRHRLTLRLFMTGLSILPLAEVADGALEAFTTASASTREDACADLIRTASSVTSNQLRKLYKAFTAPDASWSVLVQGQQSSNVAEAFLALMMATLGREGAVRSDALVTLLAALRCPGAAKHGAFHPLAIFEVAKVLRVLLVDGAEPQGAAGRRKAGGAASRAKPPAKSKGSRSRPGAAADGDVDMADAADDASEDGEEEEQRAGGGAGSSTGGAGSSKSVLLDELALLLEHVPLASNPEALSQLTSLCASVGAYTALFHCCARHHGEPEVTIPAVLRAVLPTLSLANGGATSGGAIATASAVVAAQKRCEAFVVRVVSESVAACALGGEDAERRVGAALQAVQALLQRTVDAAPDRAEPRSQICASLGRLLVSPGLPGAVAARFAGFLWVFSRQSKISQRTLAVEMAAALLNASLSKDAAPTPAGALSLLEDGTPQTLWRILVSRLADKATGVRAKALQCVGTALSEMHKEGPERALLRAVQQPLPFTSSPRSASASGGTGDPRSLGQRHPGRRSAVRRNPCVVGGARDGIVGGAGGAGREPPLAVGLARRRGGDDGRVRRRPQQRAHRAVRGRQTGGAPRGSDRLRRLGAHKRCPGGLERREHAPDALPRHVAADPQAGDQDPLRGAPRGLLLVVGARGVAGRSAPLATRSRAQCDRGGPRRAPRGGGAAARGLRGKARGGLCHRRLGAATEAHRGVGAPPAARHLQARRRRR